MGGLIFLVIMILLVFCISQGSERKKEREEFEDYLLRRREQMTGLIDIMRTYRSDESKRHYTQED